jgi:ribulose-5-phosphate 4-epimerase/fuculose-1-phosphate aldolase
MGGSVSDDLVAGCAILDGEGLTTAFGHLSARVAREAILISGNVGPGLVDDAAGLLTIDTNGTVLDGDPVLLPGETAIHLRVFRRRDDVASVCRFHGPSCLAWSTLGRPLPAVIGMGLFLGSSVPWFDTSSTVRDATHADALAACLGGGAAVLLRGFGAVTVGRSVSEAVVRAWLLERSAAAALAASPIGEPMPYPGSAAEPFAAGDGPAAAQVRRAWSYLRRCWPVAWATRPSAEQVLTT